MKKIILLVLVALPFAGHAQNNDYLVSMKAIGSMKLDMKQADVEKLLNKKFTLKHAAEKEGAWTDTVKSTYKNTSVTLYFERVYEDEKKYTMQLSGIMVDNPLYKTKEGISIGTDKLKIVTTYEFNRVEIAPEYEDPDYTRLSKTLVTIYVYDDTAETTLVYHMKNKKVVSIEVMHYYGD
jgi:hypothetical protein